MRRKAAGNQIPNRDVVEKLNFLTNVLESIGNNPDLAPLSEYLATDLIGASNKSQIRVRPRPLMCRKCRMPLCPPNGVITRVTKDYTVYKCSTCETSFKQYHHNEETFRSADTTSREIKIPPINQRRN